VNCSRNKSVKEMLEIDLFLEGEVKILKEEKE